MIWLMLFIYFLIKVCESDATLKRIEGSINSGIPNSSKLHDYYNGEHAYPEPEAWMLENRNK